MAKKQRNSPARARMLARRRAEQEGRGSSLPQKASEGRGNYPGGVRRYWQSLGKWDAKERRAVP